MHCPQCGQQQATGEVRFCSRCGFPLGGVIELLALGGNLPVSEAQPQRRKRSPKYEGIRQGVMMFFLGAVVVPLLGILTSSPLHSNFLEILTAMAAVFFFVGGFVRILYAAIFEEGMQYPHPAPQPAALPYVPAVAQTQLNAGLRNPALPPQQTIPVSSWRRPNTAEIVQPPSVTENTTRLLSDPPEQNQK